MIVNIDEFMHKYESRLIPCDIHIRLMNARAAFIELPDNIESIMLMRKEEDTQRDSDYAKISYHRNQGMEAEAKEDYDGALLHYIDSIQEGESSRFGLLHAYRMSYDRAIALARLTNNEHLEKELIHCLLSHSLSISERMKLSERLTALSA